ncbi:MAG: hypothetical protein M3040_13690 [Bacteroidota bacterium]|nr:hypothetical protein [Bacteroidota bacterium]
MKTSYIILQRIIAILLMCIFALSITPSVVFHNLFSTHKDHDIAHNHTHSNEIAKAGINCHFNNLVCKNHFIILSTAPSSASKDFSARAMITSAQHFYSQHHFFAELRGPPTDYSC